MIFELLNLKNRFEDTLASFKYRELQKPKTKKQKAISDFEDTLIVNQIANLNMCFFIFMKSGKV